MSQDFREPIGLVDNDRLGSRVDEPAKPGAVAQTVQDIASDFRLVLSRGEDFNDPGGGKINALAAEIAVDIEGDFVLTEDSNVGNDGATIGGAAQFRKGFIGVGRVSASAIDHTDQPFL